MGSPFATLVRRKPPSNANNVPERTAGERNVRPYVVVGAQDAPDPIRQGETPHRAARMPVVFFAFDAPYQEDQFAMDNLEISYASRTMKGRQTPFTPRTNLAVPPHAAYGSLFTADLSAPYQLG